MEGLEKAMKAANCNQMREIDGTTINKMGIPGIVLMENAALKVVKRAKELLGTIENKNIIVFCGRGNNGGDGFVVARHLNNIGANVIVILCGDKTKIKGDALINFKIIQKMKIKIIEVIDKNILEKAAHKFELCDLIIDALFGTGIKGEIRGIAKDAINLINYLEKPVLAVDIPSGVNGDDGSICGTCIKADTTVTFGLPKIGVISYPGANFVGKLYVEDISIPKSVIDEININVEFVENGFIKNLFSTRKKVSNKGDYGKIFLVAGSRGMTGAATLSGLSAIKSGAGLVTLGIPESLNDIMEAKLTEVMTIPLSDKGNGTLSSSAIPQIIEKIEKSDVLVYGPGLSTTEDVKDILEQVLKKCNLPIIIDADGINVLSKNINVLKESNCSVILTPHPGEMSRLTGLDISYIQSNRIKVASKFSKEWNVIVVLKGARTITACPNGKVFINSTGNPGMATAGSGDVLTGIIAALIGGQGINLELAVAGGVYIHGKAGDNAARLKGEHGLIASDIIQNICEVMKVKI